MKLSTRYQRIVRKVIGVSIVASAAPLLQAGGCGDCPGGERQTDVIEIAEERPTPGTDAGVEDVASDADLEEDAQTEDDVVVVADDVSSDQPDSGDPSEDYRPYPQRMLDSLNEFRAENPDATAQEQLEYVFSLPYYPRYYGVPQEIADLMVVAAQDNGGQFPAGLCQTLCDPESIGDAECSLTEPEIAPYNPPKNPALFCTAFRSPECGAGRLPQGCAVDDSKLWHSQAEFWAFVSTMEQAAVHAFAELTLELRAFGAPEELSSRALDAMADEVRHAQRTARLAKSLGATPKAPERAPTQARSLYEFALDNAEDGCVREAWAALEATWIAESTVNPEIAEVAREIAADESRHAELSWDMLAWSLGQMGPAGPETIKEAIGQSLQTLRETLESRPKHVGTFGLPVGADALALFERFESLTWGMWNDVEARVTA